MLLRSMLFRPVLTGAAISLILSGCGRTNDGNISMLSGNGEPAEVSGNEAISGADVSRQIITTMTFTKWGDVIIVDAGVTKDAAGKCVYVDPIKSDASTKWSPLQIYWAIFDSAADVKNGTKIEGIFSETDVSDAALLSRTDGVKPFGFAYLSEQAAGYVNLTPIEKSDGGTTLTTILDISGHKAAIRAKVSEKDGQCVSMTEACRGGAECLQGGSVMPLGNIHVVQSMLGLPKEIKQAPTSGVSSGQ